MRQIQPARRSHLTAVKSHDFPPDVVTGFKPAGAAKMPIFSLYLILLVLLLTGTARAEDIPTFTPPVFTGSETAEEKGLIIAKAVRRRDAGYGSAELRNKGVTKNIRGEERVLLSRGYIYEKGADNAQKQLFVFDSPADIIGLGALVHVLPSAPQGQWTFIPELQRVKRVSGETYASSFMGTAFYNEDLTLSFPLVERYSYKYVRDEEYEGLPCYVMDSFPLYDHSIYKRFRWWVDQKDFQFRKMEFYDLKDAHIKTLFLKDYKLYLDYWWRFSAVEMVDHQMGKTTTVTYTWKVRTGLDEDDFSVNALKRVR